MGKGWRTRAKKGAATLEDPEDVKAIEELLAEAEAEAVAEQPPETRRAGKKTAPWNRAAAKVKQKRQERAQRAQREASQWTGGGDLTTKLVSVGLGACVLAGPVGLGVALTDSDAPVQQAGGGFDQDKINRRDAANEAATQFIRAWLGATKESSDALRDWWPAMNSLNLPEEATTSSDLNVVRATASAPGLWTVVVGADVTPPGEKVAQRRYYQVPVAVSGATNVAAEPTALPAQIPPPSNTVKDVALAYPQGIQSKTPAATSAEGFLTAMLTGSGDIRLYQRPGVRIPRITPPPAASITVSELLASKSTDETAIRGDTPPTGSTANVLATVQLSQKPGGADDGQDVTTLQYVLQMVARDGRWEVTAITAPPALSDPATQDQEAPTPTS